MPRTLTVSVHTQPKSVRFRGGTRGAYRTAMSRDCCPAQTMRQSHGARKRPASAIPMGLSVAFATPLPLLRGESTCRPNWSRQSRSRARVSRKRPRALLPIQSGLPLGEEDNENVDGPEVAAPVNAATPMNAAAPVDTGAPVDAVVPLNFAVPVDAGVPVDAVRAKAEGPQMGGENVVPSEIQEGEKATDSKVAGKGFLVWAWSVLKRAIQPGGFLWGLAAGLAVSAAVFFLPDSGIDASLREKVTLFDFILQDISSSYVDRVDLNKLFESGVNSMLGTLDPYTQFENNAEAVEMSVKSTGRYAGVGLGISSSSSQPSLLQNGESSFQIFNSEADRGASDEERPDTPGQKRVVVVSAFEGYAFDAGVRPGDVIDTIASEPVSGLSLEKVTEKLRGEPGTTVEVTVLREGHSSPMKFTLARRSVQIKDVPVATFVGKLEDGIGYIRLQSFAKDAATEVRVALQGLLDDAKEASPKLGLRGLVLDLRGNPGGLLSAAVEVSESIVPRNSVVVSTKGRGLESGPTYKSSQDPVLPKNLPLAVLVNGQTASASEIVAGAVQDLDYGVIVGSRTFGKGLVQNVQELPYQTALKYTVGRYYTPSGRCIQALNYQQGGGTDGPFETKQVEESQRKEFKTQAGRIVTDGGGISPDVQIEKRASFLELALQRQNMFFYFANRYGAEHVKSESLPKDFAVTDGLYKEFTKFVSQSKFKYESRFDEAFEQLQEMFKDVGYDAARSRVTDLKRATEGEMKMDFVRHERDIRTRLESAIRYRFQPDSERIIAELKDDDQLAEAIRVLKEPTEYARLLAPQRTVGSLADSGIKDASSALSSSAAVIDGPQS